jgi:hypothetical protein
VDHMEIPEDQVISLAAVAPGVRGLRITFVNVFAITQSSEGLDFDRCRPNVQRTFHSPLGRKNFSERRRMPWCYVTDISTTWVRHALAGNWDVLFMRIGWSFRISLAKRNIRRPLTRTAELSVYSQAPSGVSADKPFAPRQSRQRLQRIATAR